MRRESEKKTLKRWFGKRIDFEVFGSWLQRNESHLFWKKKREWLYAWEKRREEKRREGEAREEMTREEDLCSVSLFLASSLFPLSVWSVYFFFSLTEGAVQLAIKKEEKSKYFLGLTGLEQENGVIERVFLSFSSHFSLSQIRSCSTWALNLWEGVVLSVSPWHEVSQRERKKPQKQMKWKPKLISSFFLFLHFEFNWKIPSPAKTTSGEKRKRERKSREKKEGKRRGFGGRDFVLRKLLWSSHYDCVIHRVREGWVSGTPCLQTTGNTRTAHTQNTSSKKRGTRVHVSSCLASNWRR